MYHPRHSHENYYFNITDISYGVTALISEIRPFV
jgi:hypothetical protein